MTTKTIEGDNKRWQKFKFSCGNEQLNSLDLLWCNQQKLSDGGGGGHGVSVHTVDLESSRHAPHPLVSGQYLLITKENPIGIFDWIGREEDEVKQQRK